MHQNKRQMEYDEYLESLEDQQELEDAAKLELFELDKND